MIDASDFKSGGITSWLGRIGTAAKVESFSDQEARKWLIQEAL
jgi:hypothetical protein